MFDKIKSWLKEYNVLESFLIFGSIITVNFVVYVIYFDMNTLMLIDSSTIAKHAFGFIILYSFISASTTILILFVQNYVLIKHDTISFIPIIKIEHEDNSTFYQLLSSKVFKYFLIIIIFSCIYIGIYNSLIVVGIFLGYFTFIIIVDFLKKQKKPIHESKEVQEQLKFIDDAPKILKNILKTGLSFEYIIRKEIDIIKRGNFLQFILTRLGIMLIFISLLLGIGRANYIEKTSLVKINTNTNNLTLIFTTKDGVCLFNSEKNQASFIAWGSIDNMLLIPENSYAIRNLFSGDNKALEEK